MAGKRKEEKESPEKTYRKLEQERKRLESSYAELRESKDELVRSEKLVFTGRIAANIAHEIRNPLTNVSMSLQQLKKAIKPKNPLHKHVDIIKRNTERINFLITELLNCARPPKLEIKPYNIHRLLKDVLMSSSTKLKARKIKIIKKLTPRPAIIKIDKEHMERVFLNIINNAIDAIPKGGKLAIITEYGMNRFIVRIQDTGKGIPEKDIIRIFDPFFSEKRGGVGLGLTLSYGIIVGHGGTIEVESKVRKGSTFSISLPIR